jgi:hypothetical protein
MAAMLAVVFHYWLGLILLVVGFVAVAALAAGYVKSVTAKQYPGRRHRDD